MHITKEKKPKTVFVNVSIITMLNDTILANQSVVITDGKIEYIGNSAQVSIPKDIFIIDGKTNF